jgi:hypothetical protein
LPRRNGAFGVTTTRKQELAGPFVGDFQIVVDRLAGLFAQFKSDRSSGLLLSDCGAVSRIPARSDILDLDRTTSQPRSLLSIAKLNMARSRARPSIWSFVRIDQTCLGRNGGFAPVTLPLFQGTENHVPRVGLPIVP